MAGRRDKGGEREIARERMDSLFAQAAEAAKDGNMERAGEYVGKARTIGMRFNVRPRRDQKRSYCKHCYGFLKPGATSSSRVNSRLRRVEVSCKSCGKRMFYPLKPKDKR